MRETVRLDLCLGTTKAGICSNGNKGTLCPIKLEAVC